MSSMSHQNFNLIGRTMSTYSLFPSDCVVCPFQTRDAHLPFSSLNCPLNQPLNLAFSSHDYPIKIAHHIVHIRQEKNKTPTINWRNQTRWKWVGVGGTVVPLFLPICSPSHLILRLDGALKGWGRVIQEQLWLPIKVKTRQNGWSWG